MTNNCRIYSRRPEARGFTLIELMIALTVGTLILAGLAVLFSVNSGNQNELERTVRQVESARYAIDTMSEDVMHAGFYSDFNPNALLPAPAYQGPGAVSPCVTATNALGWDTVSSPIKLPIPVEGIAAGTVIACAINLNRRAGTEAIVVRHADTGSAITLPSSTANLYIQISRCKDDVQRLIASPGPSTKFTLRLPDCTTVNNAARRLLQRTYYIATCNDCAANDGIPTLKRVEMIDGELRTTSIAEGIENLQVEYGEDTTGGAGDGEPDIFVAATGVTNWNNVVAVRLHLLARATETTAGYSDSRTYNLGPNVSIAKPNDGFKRTLLTTTVRLINVGGRRE